MSRIGTVRLVYMVYQALAVAFGPPLASLYVHNSELCYWRHAEGDEWRAHARVAISERQDATAVPRPGPVPHVRARQPRRWPRP